MDTRTPYGPDTNVRLLGSQLFFVDPNVSNEGGVFPIPGSKIGYPYRLPFLSHNLPLRRIRWVEATDITVVPPLVNSTNANFLTLRKSDGTFLLDRVPMSEFQSAAGTFLPGVVQRQLFFDDDFFPDPELSFLQWQYAGVTERTCIEFLYG